MTEQELLPWLEQMLHARVIQTSRIAVGNARLTSVVDLEADLPGTRSVILRHETGDGPLSGTIFSLEREAAVCKALQGRGLPVPAVLATSVELSAIATERMMGSQDNDGRCMADYMRLLRKLHDIDISTLELPFTTSIDGEITAWRSIYETHVTRPSVIAELAFDSLLSAQPSEPRRPVLCHGDAGFGNYLIEDGRVSALLDWEMAHFGDPVDELVWIAIRAVQFDRPLDHFSGMISRHYGISSDLDLSPSRIGFWKGFGLLRMLIICLLAVSKPRSGKERLLQLSMLPGLEFQLLEALAQLEGYSVLPLLDEAPLESSAFPSELVGEAAQDLDKMVLPELPESAPLINWTKRIRNLMRELSKAAKDKAAEPVELALKPLANAKARELRWQPSSAALARRSFPNLTESDNAH